ncbi:beta-lactamase-like protein [Halenospora varia]|nr:beta-lactamase-like protein [Halenospora varia]
MSSETTYPPEDNTDFLFAARGHRSSVDPCIILSEDKKDVVYNSEAYKFITVNCSTDKVNPSLWREGQLYYKQSLFKEERGARSIKALIYTHSHADHFGGTNAITEAKVASPDLEIYAPEGFLEHAMSENVYTRNTMARRANPEGQIGKSSIKSLTKMISTTKEEALVDDDLRIVFWVTPGTEAPSEMNFDFPQYNALCMAENATHTMHNIQTLRGALGKGAKVAFASHHWPTFGNDKINEFLSCQRDLYAYPHNETLRQLNAGQTGLKIAEDFKLPHSLEQIWNLPGYYGSVSHNFDGNPAHLWEHPPTAAAQRYVHCIGSIEKVIDLAPKYRDKTTPPDLRFATTLLSHANATWRNFFLCGAQELLEPTTRVMLSMDVASFMALSIEQLMDTLAIRVDGLKAWDVAPFTIKLVAKDLNTIWWLNLSNGVVTGYEIKPEEDDKEATLKMWVTHQGLVDSVIGVTSGLDGIKTSSDLSVWGILTSVITTSDSAFAIVTPEKLNLPEEIPNWFKMRFPKI